MQVGELGRPHQIMQLLAIATVLNKHPIRNQVLREHRRLRSRVRRMRLVGSVVVETLWWTSRMLLVYSLRVGRCVRPGRLGGSTTCSLRACTVCTWDEQARVSARSWKHHAHRAV